MSVSGDGARLETFVSVDVEAAGPIPGLYSLLSIGACLVADPDESFYIELQPTTRKAAPRALEISGLSFERLAQTGTPPKQAMTAFAAWIAGAVASPARPVFVAFNAAFDWAFINYYFHETIRRNPFGHAALDIKAYYMGRTGVRWDQTGMRHVGARYGQAQTLSHHALRDAQDQARLFATMLAEAG